MQRQHLLNAYALKQQVALNLASRVTLPAFLIVSLAGLTATWQTCGAFAGCAMLSSVVTSGIVWCGDFQPQQCAIAMTLAHTTCFCAGGGHATLAGPIHCQRVQLHTCWSFLPSLLHLQVLSWAQTACS